MHDLRFFTVVLLRICLLGCDLLHWVSGSDGLNNHRVSRMRTVHMRWINQDGENQIPVDFNIICTS